MGKIAGTWQNHTHLIRMSLELSFEELNPSK